AHSARTRCRQRRYSGGRCATALWAATNSAGSIRSPIWSWISLASSASLPWKWTAPAIFSPRRKMKSARAPWKRKDGSCNDFGVQRSTMSWKPSARRSTRSVCGDPRENRYKDDRQRDARKGWKRRKHQSVEDVEKEKERAKNLLPRKPLLPLSPAL